MESNGEFCLKIGVKSYPQKISAKWGKGEGFFYQNVPLLKILINYLTYYELVVSENAYGSC